MAPCDLAFTGHVSVAYQNEVCLGARETCLGKSLVALVRAHAGPIIAPRRGVHEERTSAIRKVDSLLKGQSGEPLELTATDQAASGPGERLASVRQDAPLLCGVWVVDRRNDATEVARQDVPIRIAPNASEADEVSQPRDHLDRVWPVSHRVAKTPELLDPLVSGSLDDRIECDDVSMDIGEDGDSHPSRHTRHARSFNETASRRVP